MPNWQDSKTSLAITFGALSLSVVVSCSHGGTFSFFSSDASEPGAACPTPPHTALMEPILAAVGRTDGGCTAFHVGGGLVVTAASCLVGGSAALTLCRDSVCHSSPPEAASFCGGDIVGGSQLEIPLAPQESGESITQSNIPPSCYKKLCLAEIGMAHDDARNSPLRITWNGEGAARVSNCTAIVAAYYEQGVGDFVVLAVENPPSAKVELMYEVDAASSSSGFGMVGYAEDGKLSFLKEFNSPLFNSPLASSEHSEKECSRAPVCRLSPGSPVIDRRTGVVVGMQMEVAKDFRCRQTAIIPMSILKNALSQF